MTIDKQLPSTRTAELDSICLKAEVIPVITIERLEDAVPLGRALVEGGLTVLEITLRTDCALDAIKRMKEALPGGQHWSGHRTHTCPVSPSRTGRR